MVCCAQEAQHDTQTAPSLDELHVQDEEESDLAKDPKKARTLSQPACCVIII